ncbi:PQQ-binding-like beta-propeller repeat protein [Fuerstiella marisgermanici]|uniref:Quinoprotein ethanol dehydrogenase n=1 Tax=Fuerstiella marisgermanici TaxID=1891926 RepID=A0A1P8WIJ8_9PLAN|nr:PQQ-binding-like beta-propeller repeat protein [Fuerstiella marisgermanici]APZ93876.1 Quinoprotein ethanol dehydrogenase precursor [Fuerstiella marisgermanici]
MNRAISNLISLAVILASAAAQSADWPQFLGPNRNGISSETNLIDAFPDTGPKILWRSSLGVGMANVAVVNGKVFTLYQDDSSQYAVALDEETGDQVWRTSVAPKYNNGQGNGPRATPTVHDGTVFVFSGEGVLAALSAASGDQLWSVDTVSSLKAKPADYGMASSPLIAGDAVIVQVGSKQGAVAAYNRNDGKLIWTAGSGAAGYSSPVVLTLAGKQQVVAFVGASVLGIDPDSGDLLWSYDYETEYACNTASPVQLDKSSLLISAGENHGSTILKIESAADGFTAASAWSSLGNSSVLRAEWQTPILHDGHLFAMDNIGSAGPITNLVCVRIADGEQVWMKPRFGKSNLTMADGKLFISTAKGELVLVKATPSGFEEVSRAEVLQKMTRQAPVIANGRLYLRDDREVVCLDVRKR